ncbi:MAG: hypothetical protein AAB723_00250 [Patescibacteria group bacterium]
MQEAVLQELKMKSPEYWDATENELLIIPKESFCLALEHSFSIGKIVGSLWVKLGIAITSWAPLCVTQSFKEIYLGLNGSVWEAVLFLVGMILSLYFLVSLARYATNWYNGNLNPQKRASKFFNRLITNKCAKIISLNKFK